MYQNIYVAGFTFFEKYFSIHSLKQIKGEWNFKVVLHPLVLFSWKGSHMHTLEKEHLFRL